ncbi:hypothetical protein [Flagellimonas amoyensis]|uniref:hypothetical protein n=1 Tax=Flagellimonas amoyensis TaxID=2169401 RepID=UPI000D34AD19|nr:hypothetical protein [Allomuricauda amoyensis]
MSLPRKNNTDHQHSGAKVFEAANGLDEFLKTIEKDFFAEVKMHFKHDKESKKTDMILDLHFNFGITESLHFFTSGTWGGMTFPEREHKVSSSLEKAFAELNSKNNFLLDISEASLHFKDTSIIISRVYEQSIPDQIGNILLKASEHFVYYTKGLTEIPYEIFVPVYEYGAPSVFEPKKGKSSYFDYWGLYFEDDSHQVMIYSLHKRKMYEVDLFLFE